MTKTEIIVLLKNEYQKLFDWLENQPEENWDKGPKGKWTTGQQVVHLVQSIKPLNKALGLPKFILSYKFGKSNRTLRDYDTVIKRYQDRLTENQGAAIEFNKDLKKPTLEERAKLIKTLKHQNRKLQAHTKKWKDIHLDMFILPHPLMGKMPIREIIMWSAHHVEHHTNTLRKDY